MKQHFISTEQDHRIALLAALAITIHIFESAIPSPLPGIKPGLANVVTLFAFIQYGWQSALQISLLRVIISSLLLGTFLSPTFLLSLSGALLSLFAITLIQFPFYLHWHWPQKVLKLLSLSSTSANLQAYQPSAIGYAIIASISHMGGQFFMAWYFFIPHPGLFKLLPILITFAVILGIVSGIITQFLINQYKQSSDL
jgi:heptaprenyl diphosphate synthase